MTTLAERTVLAALHLGAWSGMVHDRAVTEEVSEQHKADAKGAGRYTKQLVSTRFIQHVSKVDNEARTTHRILTLPWDDNGTRILTTDGYLEYTKHMRTIRIKREAAVKEFVSQLVAIIADGKERLGTMFDEAEYPTAAEVASKFFFDVEINKVPESGDFRAGLNDAQVKTIVKDIESRTNARVEAAVRDVYQRVFDATNKMAVRLREFTPKMGEQKAAGKFHDSLVYNVMTLADSLPLLNITQDDKLYALAKQLKADLVEHSPEILRVDAKARNDTARKAEKLAKAAKAFLG